MSTSAVRRWPLVLIAAPAAVAVWSGWVGLGGMCGFGLVQPFPGIVAWHLDTAITLPVGVEAYGAYALGAWLTPGTRERARTFARRSAIGALTLGMLGQVVYHPLAAAAKVPITDMTATPPVSDANSVAISLVDAAGKDGAVVLNFTPPDALTILQAAQKLNIEDNVKLWACSTPCNTDYLAQSLGSKWNGKIFVNAELTPPDPTNTATMNLYKAILHQYGSAVSGGVGSFSQMGFTEAEIMVKALESVNGAYTVASVNAAIKGLKNVNTGMLCQAWSYGSYSMHIPNNEDYTVTADNGKMVLAPNGGCTQISAVDPQIAQYRQQAGTAALDPTSGS